MNNSNTQLNVVIAFIKEGASVVASKFAKENGISARTLGRWVVNHRDAAVQFISNENGLMVSANDEEIEEVEVIEVPVAAPVKAKTPKTPKEPKVAVDSKRIKAAVIFASNPTMTRKEMIAEMVGIGLTAAGASTYISNFKTGKWTV